ncbi:MAG: hypothetical protein Q7V88_02835 [Actinomycetota bacterium]|nr:hypothetical protein [Actinomycetota bacterium]
MVRRDLDIASSLTGDLVVDALFLMRRLPWHWPAVAVGIVLGTVGSLAVGAPVPFVVAAALVGAGAGMNVGSEFRFVARTTTRVVLLGSSRVIGRPTRVLRYLQPAEVVVKGRGITTRLMIGGEHHAMAPHQRARLERMLAGAHHPTAPAAPLA